MYAESLYTGGMRGAWPILCVLWLGCGFQIGATGDAGAAGEGPVVDARALDGLPDAVSVLPTCATDPAYVAAPVGNHRYRVYPNLDYDSGFDRCTQDGAHLAVVNDQAEDTFVSALANADSWIGYDDLRTEGTFRWVTGSSSAFTQFSANEPNDNNGEDCVYTRPDGTWNDTACDNLRPAICECDPAFTPKPTPACRLNQAGSVKHRGRVYTIHTTPQTWDDAETDCASTGATIAVIADNDENVDIDGEFPADSWIGYTDAAVEGTFVWVDGTPVGYTQWSIGEPVASATKDCAVVNVDWFVNSCTATKKYACECNPNPP